MTLVCFAGGCWPDPDGLCAFAFTIRGVGSAMSVEASCGTLDEANGNTAHISAWMALGKALTFLVNSKTPVAELRIFSDARNVIDQLVGRAQCESPRVTELRDRCRKLLKDLGAVSEKVKAEWIPTAQNVECHFLARAAYVGRTGKQVPAQAAEQK